MVNFKSETLKKYAQVYHLYLDKNMTIKELYEHTLYGVMVISRIITICKNILADPTNINYKMFMKHLSEIRLENTKEQESCSSQETLTEEKKEENDIYSLQKRMNEILRTHNDIESEKERLRLEADKMLVKLYGDFSNILSDFYYFIVSLSSKEIESLVIKSTGKIDELLHRLHILNKEVEEVIELKNSVFHFVSRQNLCLNLTIEFVGNFHFKRKALTNILLSLKNPTDFEKRKEVLRYFQPFNSFSF